MRLGSARDISAALGAGARQGGMVLLAMVVADASAWLAHSVTSADVAGAVTLDARAVIMGAVLAVISLVLQKRGHALEEQPVHAFASTKDFVRRLYAEQFCDFWRFLFTGAWYESFERAQR